MYRMRKNGIVTQKNANKREKSVDFVSKKVYSIQALNERASQISQRNEKSTDRKKKVLDKLECLMYNKKAHINEQNIVPCKLNNVT